MKDENGELPLQIEFLEGLLDVADDMEDVGNSLDRQEPDFDISAAQTENMTTIDLEKENAPNQDAVDSGPTKAYINLLNSRSWLDKITLLP